MYNPSTTTANFFYFNYHSNVLYKIKGIQFGYTQRCSEMSVYLVVHAYVNERLSGQLPIATGTYSGHFAADNKQNIVDFNQSNHW